MGRCTLQPCWDGLLTVDERIADLHIAACCREQVDLVASLGALRS